MSQISSSDLLSILKTEVSLFRGRNAGPRTLLGLCLINLLLEINLLNFSLGFTVSELHGGVEVVGKNLFNLIRNRFQKFRIAMDRLPREFGGIIDFIVPRNSE